MCCRPTTASTCRATCRSSSAKDIQAITDAEGKEVPSKRIYDRFLEVYVDQPGARLKFLDHHTFPDTEREGPAHRRGDDPRQRQGDDDHRLAAPARSTASSMRCRAISASTLSVLDYSEHSMQRGSNAAAISYMEMEHPGGKLFGAGINTNIVAASLEAVVSAANRILK